VRRRCVFTPNPPGPLFFFFSAPEDLRLCVLPPFPGHLFSFTPPRDTTVCFLSDYPPFPPSLSLQPVLFPFPIALLRAFFSVRACTIFPPSSRPIFVLFPVFVFAHHRADAPFFSAAPSAGSWGLPRAVFFFSFPGRDRSLRRRGAPPFFWENPTAPLFWLQPIPPPPDIFLFTPVSFLVMCALKARCQGRLQAPHRGSRFFFPALLPFVTPALLHPVVFFSFRRLCAIF